jgi:serine palmitoyltransferase
MLARRGLTCPPHTYTFQVKQLHDNANYVRRRLLEMGLHVLGDWNSPVMPIMIYHSGKLPVFSRMCLENHVAMVRGVELGV